MSVSMIGALPVTWTVSVRPPTSIFSGRSTVCPRLTVTLLLLDGFEALKLAADGVHARGQERAC